jgi:Cu+-exporting ATPase
MTCAACARASERAARKLPGVEEASVNYATEKMVVTFDDRTVDGNAIEAAVARPATRPWPSSRRSRPPYPSEG